MRGGGLDAFITVERVGPYVKPRDIERTLKNIWRNTPMDISISRIVHYVDDQGTHWPFLVTSVHDTDEVNGRVFRDADDLKVADVPYSDGLETHTWHWSERVP